MAGDADHSARTRSNDMVQFLQDHTRIPVLAPMRWDLAINTSTGQS